MQFTGQNNGRTASSAFLLARKCNWLARTCIMNMRNALCVRTQTSKVPAWVALLFLSYSMLILSNDVCLRLEELDYACLSIQLFHHHLNMHSYSSALRKYILWIAKVFLHFALHIRQIMLINLTVLHAIWSLFKLNNSKEKNSCPKWMVPWSMHTLVFVLGTFGLAENRTRIFNEGWTALEKTLYFIVCYMTLSLSFTMYFTGLFDLEKTGAFGSVAILM